MREGSRKKLTIFWIARPRRTFCKNIKASSSSSSNWNTNQTFYQGLFGTCYWLKNAGETVLQIRLMSVRETKNYTRVWFSSRFTVCLLLPYKVMRQGWRQTWDKEAQRQTLRWKYLWVFIALTVTCSFLTLMKWTTTVELRFNEPLYNEVLDITNILVVFSKIRLIEVSLGT